MIASGCLRMFVIVSALFVSCSSLDVVCLPPIVEGWLVCCVLGVVCVCLVVVVCACVYVCVVCVVRCYCACLYCL